MPGSVTTPQQVIHTMLNSGARVNAREVDDAARTLRRHIETLEPEVPERGSGAEADRAVTTIERIGAGQAPLRNGLWPDEAHTTLPAADVTSKARGAAARHGALLRTLLDKHPGTGTLSFSELAAARTTAMFDDVCDAVAGLSLASMPHEPDVKATRKAILKLRDFMDVFVHAYAGGAAEQEWRRLREELDQGYELIGRFKDLFDAQRLQLVPDGTPTEPGRTVTADQVRYVDAEVSARRAEVLVFRDSLLADPAKVAMRAFLSNPAADAQRVEDKNLPRFYWGDLDIRPRRGERGIEALRRLGSAMSRTIEDEIGSIEDVKKIRTIDDENVVHDVRKRMRSLVNLTLNFPELAPVSGDAAKAHATLVAAVARYGELSDTFAAFHLAHERGEKRGVTELQDRIDEQWSALRKWQKEERLHEALLELARDVTASRRE